MEITAVEWLCKQYHLKQDIEIIKQAKELEQQQIDNKVIHFAEWLTKKHPLLLMELYNHFEEQFYNKQQ